MPAAKANADSIEFILALTEFLVESENVRVDRVTLTPFAA
jgi:hypothetical protein